MLLAVYLCTVARARIDPEPLWLLVIAVFFDFIVQADFGGNKTSTPVLLLMFDQ